MNNKQQFTPKTSYKLKKTGSDLDRQPDRLNINQRTPIAVTEGHRRPMSF
uniref:Uncharacterized protein n=1 Tax=Parascaris equorum TaxID=6256 RepID=A0A914RG26_PAREQ